MLDDFFDSLPATGDHWFGTGHGFKVNATESFASAGQREHSAAAHGLRHCDTALAAKKVNLLSDPQVPCQYQQARQFRALPDNSTLHLWPCCGHPGDGSQKKLMAFGRNQVADGQDFILGKAS